MRVGFVGLGFATRSLHVPAIATLPSGVIVGGVDPAPEQAAAWRELGAGPVLRLVRRAARARGDRTSSSWRRPPTRTPSSACGARGRRERAVREAVRRRPSTRPTRCSRSPTRAGRWVAVNQEFRYMPIFARAAARSGARGHRARRCSSLHAVHGPRAVGGAGRRGGRRCPTDRCSRAACTSSTCCTCSSAAPPDRGLARRRRAGSTPPARADAVDLVTLDYGEGMLGADHDQPAVQGGHALRRPARRLRAGVAARLVRRPGASCRVGMERAERPGIRVDFGLEGHGLGASEGCGAG